LVYSGQETSVEGAVVDLTLQLFLLDTKPDTLHGGTHCLARNWMWDEDSALTLTLAGDGGMNTDYDKAVFDNFATPGALSSSRSCRPLAST